MGGKRRGPRRFGATEAAKSEINESSDLFRAFGRIPGGPTLSIPGAYVVQCPSIAWNAEAGRNARRSR